MRRFCIFLLLLAGCAVQPPRETIHVLCLASSDLKQQGLDDIDPKALKAYRGMGFELHFDYYQNVDEAKLRQYPVVVGMMPMLHAGTRAIDDRLGAAIDRYVRDGGGFLLMPTPSYYGGEDFLRQLNPWLTGFGCELLNEQPRDPANQTNIVRVLNYRYLKAQDVWLPIDFTDAYVMTHTMKLSPEWNVLLHGSPTCATCTFGRNLPGAYSNAPPFLATRDLGKGKLAVFTTSSQYFIFDAFHWAFDNGFVMREGGARLMAKLLGDLATQKLPAPPPEAAPAVVQGNVPICDDKSKWYEHVRTHFAPAGYGVRAYVDCGALSDLPYSTQRGFGYTGNTSWLIRWNWSEIFHATAANSRGFDIKPLEYRFNGLDPKKSYRLGVLVWGYQPEGSRSIRVKAGDTVLDEQLNLPRYVDKQGPAFVVYDLPATDGALNLSFSVAKGGTGTFSSVCELWLFEAGAKFQVPETVPESLAELHYERKSFRGLIGADGDIAELSAAAREAKLEFLVFLKDAATLQDLAKYKQDCAAASDGKFHAIPGITFSARYANHTQRLVDNPHSWGSVRGYVFQNLTTLPAAKDYGNPYDLFWKFFGGELTGGKGSPPTLMQGGEIPALYQRFWRGFDVISDGKDARELYADLMASGYGPFPRASGRYTTAEQIKNAEWLTTVFADNINEIEVSHYASCISNGPRIRQYGFSFDYSRDESTGAGILFKEKAWLVAHAQIESPTEIEKVTLFSGRTPLRVWYPGKTSVKIEEPILVARNHELWMHVQAKDGREAFTGRFLVQEDSFLIGMCSDNQNTICNLTCPPTKFERDDRELYLAHSYWHTGEAAGQLGAMRNARELVPRVIETGIIQPVKLFYPCPRLTFADGSTEDHGASELRMIGASSDYNQNEYRFDTPGSRAKSRVLLTSYRPKPGGDTVVLIETELEAKEDVALRGIEHLRLATLPALAASWKYTYQNVAGELKTGPFPNEPVHDKLAADGGVLLWPSDVGNVLVLPQDGRAYDVELKTIQTRTGREFIGLSTASTNLVKGEKLRSKFLVALHQGNESLPELLKKDHAGGKIVRGVNPNWTCAKVTESGMQIMEASSAELPVVEGAGYNIVLSDQPDVRLEWFAGRIHAHNPTSTTMTCRIWTNPELKDIPRVDGTWTLQPGESVWLP